MPQRLNRCFARTIEPSGSIQPLNTEGDGPRAILVVGVNGSGKTTTIGKLAARYKAEGKSVLLAAGDTFRAGAIEQIKVWGERSDIPVIAHQEGGDPAAVIFDALQAAQARGVDLVICDTAGRLQAQQALMDELAKVVRVMGKALPGAPHGIACIGFHHWSKCRVTGQQFHGSRWGNRDCFDQTRWHRSGWRGCGYL